MRKLLGFFFNRLTFFVFFMLLQIGTLFLMFAYFRDHFALFYSASIVAAACLVIFIINRYDSPEYRLAWIIPILGLPVFGVLLFLVFGKGRLSRRQTRRMLGIQSHYANAMSRCPDLTDGLRFVSPDAALQSAYLRRAAGAPLFRDTDTEYYNVGDELFPHMLDALRGAERFIFLEYFIISPGRMWDAVLAVLQEKAAAGVDVRVIYDDFGCLRKMPPGFRRELESKGIQCRVFAPLVPVLTGSLNNRDHRKILVVDGMIGCTGGINLADEYINELPRFGHWSDSGVMLRGAAVYSLTAMFLSMWGYLGPQADVDYGSFGPDAAALPQGEGFVQPFTDMPFDDERVGESTYINIISRARRYVWITTPYLIIDSELRSALCTAAKSGVDVRIITPGIPDKPMVFEATRSYYPPLIDAGVRIFEYAPGFIHAKNFICDDEYAVCGTINLDYRSLFLHCECGVWMYRARAVREMSRGYQQSLERCREITAQWCRGTPWYKRLLRSLLRVFAPLM